MEYAGMAELADAQDLGSCGAIRVGSTPTARTTSGQSPLRSVSGGSLRLTPKTALRSLAPPFNPEPAYAGLRGCFLRGILVRDWGWVRLDVTGLLAGFARIALG